MQFPKRKRQDDPDSRILPLTNVVFLLLIFFMLAGRLATPAPFDIEPPKSVSQASVQAGGFVVQVVADGRLAIDGKILPGAELKAAVSRRLGENADAEVRLTADASVAATDVVEVMQLLHDAGVNDLRLVTKAEDDQSAAAADSG